MDDLGSGFASLQSLVRLQPDFVKIDMSIIRGLTRSSPSFDLVRHISSVCRDQNIRVVAEGIECEEEAQLSSRAGCDLLQGYYLAEPQPLTPRASPSAQSTGDAPAERGRPAGDDPTGHRGAA